ncbi:hypothetical protein ACLB2K_039595 [Fragaria x ananassa]
MFGAQSSSSPFGAQTSSSPFGAFGTPSSNFGTPASTSAFGTPSSAPSFFTPSSTPAFGTPTTSSFSTGGAFGFNSAFSTQTQQQQQQTSPFQQQAPSAGGFGTQNLFGTPQQQTPSFQSTFPSQLTTQMAPVAPLPCSLADRDIQAIVDAYKDEPGNPKYGFKHLLFSVTDPQFRVKPAGVSDIMWVEAMGKLEGLSSTDRERLWPELVQGFKDLSQRLKALEGKGFRLPLMKGEADLAEKLAAITRQLKGSGAELSSRVQNLRTISRVQANSLGAGGFVSLPGSTRIHEQSLADMQEVLQQQTEAIARLGNVLKRDIRDMEIIMAEDPDTTDIMCH